MLRCALPLCWVLLFAIPSELLAQKKKSKKEKKEEITQVLEILPDPPAAVTVETARLEFLVSPMTGKGLLSAQVREALKSLKAQARGGQIARLRAFVAGTGDLRRVPAIVSEEFSEKHLPLPVVSTIQVGLLPVEGAQVVMEAVVVAKKAVNPEGLGFLSGMGGYGQEEPDQVMPMLDRALADLGKAAQLAGSQKGDMVKVTCMLSSLTQMVEVRSRVAAAFPAAGFTAFQAQRGHGAALAECEGVVRLVKGSGEPVVFLNPADMAPSPRFSKFVLVGAPRLVLTGTQVAFNFEEKDIRLAFQRMAKVLEGQKTSMKQVVFANLYPIGNRVLELARKVRFEFFDPAKPPASTALVFEGLPSMDASLAIELIAVPE
jgi:enamine deaminase RidA (YjgF/YER057c/UK114 family)